MEMRDPPSSLWVIWVRACCRANQETQALSTDSGWKLLAEGTWVLRARRPQRWNPLFPQLPGKHRVRGTREGKGRALLSSDQSRVPHLCPSPCPTPTAQSSSLPRTCDPAPPPHFASQHGLHREMPAPSSFPGCVLWGLLKGQGVAFLGMATFPASASTSFTHSWTGSASATTCISGVSLPPVSPENRTGPATQGPGS